MIKLNIKTMFILCLLGISGTAVSQDIYSYDLSEGRETLIMCRHKECQAAKSAMTKEFLYNKLTSLLRNNINRKVPLCEANPNTRTCVQDGISFNATVGATKTNVRIPSLFVLDAKGCTRSLTTDFIVDYDIEVAGTFPECQAALNKVTVECANSVYIETPGFECHFTKNGKTAVNVTYEVDYIDLDYGIIGADYTIGLDETSQGGKSGYLLMHFDNSANDNNNFVKCCQYSCPENKMEPCQCPQNAEPEQTTKVQPVEETQPIETAEIIAEVDTAPSENPPQIKEMSVKVQGKQEEIEQEVYALQVLDPRFPVIMEVEEV